LEIQREYYERAVTHIDSAGADPTTHQVVELWGRTLDAVEQQDFGKIDTEMDWAIEYRLVERYRKKFDLDLSSPRSAQLDLAYRDSRRGRGVLDVLQSNGLV